MFITLILHLSSLERLIALLQTDDKALGLHLYCLNYVET